MKDFNFDDYDPDEDYDDYGAWLENQKGALTMDWYDIDDAPKGLHPPEILLYYPEVDSFHIGKWDHETKRWDNMGWDALPSHWTPLIKPKGD